MSLFVGGFPGTNGFLVRSGKLGGFTFGDGWVSSITLNSWFCFKSKSTNLGLIFLKM
nr:hypothetical protein [Mycoplasmopsis bovis]